MTPLRLLGLSALALSVGLASSAGQARLTLPNELVNYREWTQLLKEPHVVPFELWVRCVASTPGELTAAREKYGPHAERFIRVYGNGLAEESLRRGGTRFRAGSVIVKEKLAGEPHGEANGVVHGQTELPPFLGTGGWEFLYFPASPTRRALINGARHATKLPLHGTTCSGRILDEGAVS